MGQEKPFIPEAIVATTGFACCRDPSPNTANARSQSVEAHSCARCAATLTAWTSAGFSKLGSKLVAVRPVTATAILSALLARRALFFADHRKVCLFAKVSGANTDLDDPRFVHTTDADVFEYLVIDFTLTCALDHNVLTAFKQ